MNLVEFHQTANPQTIGKPPRPVPHQNPRVFAHDGFGLPGNGHIRENPMQSIQTDHARDSRLRFIFNDTVVSLALAANATFEDVARTLGELAPRHYGNPIAIDVTLGSREGGFAELWTEQLSRARKSTPACTSRRSRHPAIFSGRF